MLYFAVITIIHSNEIERHKLNIFSILYFAVITIIHSNEIERHNLNIFVNLLTAL